MQNRYPPVVEPATKDADVNHSAMQNSIPASAALVDINADDLLDYFI